MSIQIFAHPAFLQKIALLTPTDRQAVYKCVEKLRRRQWDVGLRAKKLKGFSQRVWEARTDKGDRLLFTFSRGGIRLWELTNHDDVERISRRTFDEGSPLIEYLRIESPPSLEEEDEALCTEWIDQDIRNSAFLPLEVDEEIWRPLDREEWSRLAQGDRAQRRKLELRLTREQKELVKKPGSILLSGTAGSGKTTVAVFRLLELANRSDCGRILYLAQNPWLVRYARDLFNELLPADRRRDETIRERIAFKSLQEIAQGTQKTHEPPVGYPYFRHLYKRWPDRTLPPATAWSEIRSIVKGACLDVNKDLLDKEAYLNIGKKRAPDLQEFRPELYRDAERYQKQLIDHHLLDAVDLIRKGLRNLPPEERGGYGAIILDEVQDFTELHLELAFRLLERAGTLFCTGDLNQVVNPSGFRWEEVRKQFYRRSLGVPEMDALSTNFRSAGSIVELSEGILDLRQRLIGGPVERARSACLSSGDIPGVIDLKDRDDQKIFQAIRGMGGDSAVLTRSELERDHLRFETGSDFIFTVEEAKGLEFDAVLIWDFFGGERELWTRSLRGKILSKERPALRYEINLLYVAITRPRLKLRFFDPGGLLWKEPELRGKTIAVSQEDLSSLLTPLSQEEWGERGSYFFAHEFFDQAIACFEHSGDGEMADRSRAARHEQAGEWGEAAKLYEGLEDQPAFGRCLAQKLETEGKNEEAAFRWLAIDCAERAQLIARKSKNRVLLGIIEAAILEKNGDLLGAAQTYERLEKFDEAASCWEKQGEGQKAGDARWKAYQQEATPERLNWFESAALKGDAFSQYCLSLILEPGDPEKAFTWMVKAAQGGFPEAQFRLGSMESGNSRFWFFKAAEQGHREAQFRLGLLLEGEAPSQAEGFLRQAAEGGIVEARFRLGLLLQLRNKNRKEIKSWWLLAAEAGHPEAQYRLGLLLEEENPGQALKWLRKASEQGNSGALCRLGHLYLSGSRHAPSKAKECFRQAAEKGVSEASYELGRLYFEEDNLKEAASWFRSAAEKDHPDAQYCLARLLLQDASTTEQAEGWLRKAAEQDHPDAQFELSVRYAERDGELSLRWCRKAAERGNLDAQYKLGFHYLHGQDLPQDSELAAHWLTKAAEQGDGMSMVTLGSLFEQESEFERAAFWYQKAAERGETTARERQANLKERLSGLED